MRVYIRRRYICSPCPGSTSLWREQSGSASMILVVEAGERREVNGRDLGCGEKMGAQCAISNVQCMHAS